MDTLIQNILNILLSQIALGVYAILLLLLVILLVRSVIRNEHATNVALDAMKERITATKKALKSDETAAGEMSVANALAAARRAEEEAKKILLEEEIEILVTLTDGTASATAFGCDLTYDYVKINGDYRT